jgi:hypothetical protein
MFKESEVHMEEYGYDMVRNPGMPQVLFLFVSSFFADKEHLSEHRAEGGESERERYAVKRQVRRKHHSHKINSEKKKAVARKLKG